MMKRQRTLFGGCARSHKPYVNIPTAKFELFMNKYISLSDKTRQLAVNEGIQIWNEKYKGTYTLYISKYCLECFNYIKASLNERNVEF